MPRLSPPCRDPPRRGPRPTRCREAPCGSTRSAFRWLDLHRLSSLAFEGLLGRDGRGAATHPVVSSPTRAGRPAAGTLFTAVPPSAWSGRLLKRVDGGAAATRCDRRTHDRIGCAPGEMPLAIVCSWLSCQRAPSESSDSRRRSPGDRRDLSPIVRTGGPSGTPANNCSTPRRCVAIVAVREAPEPSPRAVPNAGGWHGWAMPAGRALGSHPASSTVWCGGISG